MTRRIDRLGAYGRHEDQLYPPIPPPPPSVVVADSQINMNEPEGIWTKFNFKTTDKPIIIDDVEIWRGGGLYHINRHPRMPADDPNWDYSLWADGTDDLPFTLRFLRPVYGWAIHGSCFIPDANGNPIPSYPYAYTWCESDAINPRFGDISHHMLSAPDTHNKNAYASNYGNQPTGWLTRAEMGVYVGGTGSNVADDWFSMEKRNGFIGGYLQWER